MARTLPFVDGDEQTETEAAFYARLRSLASAYTDASEVRRIAVVGNQPLDPSAQRAKIIDSADLVFRVNGFRADGPGDAPTVGARTDIVVFNRGVRPTPWFFQDFRERLYLLVEPGRMLWENPKVPEFWPQDLGFVTMPNREVVLPLGEAVGMDARKGQWATTGTMMLWIATRLFPDAQVAASGFSFVDQPEQLEWKHAYGDPSPVGAEHLIALESKLARRWIESGRITYHP